MSKQKYPQSTSTATTTSGIVTRKRRNHYSQVVNHAKQDRKRKEAYARQDKYESMTLTEQLNSCVPGGSKRQRARIEAAIASATAPAKSKAKKA